MFEQKHFYYSFAHTPTDHARRHWLHIHSVGWVACRSDYDVERRAFYGYQLLYVIRGKGHIHLHESDEGEFVAEAGDVVLLNLTDGHRYFADNRDPWEFIWVHFGGVSAIEYYRQLEAGRTPITHTGRSSQNKGSESRLFKRVFDLFRAPDAPKLAIDAKAHSLVTRILSDLIVIRVEAQMTASPLPTASDSPDAIRRGIQYIERCYMHPLTLQEIAHHASLSPYHFAREFKRATDYSVMGYLHEFRMAQAKRLLRESELSIREIGEKVGFPDQSYFGMRFKQHEHMTPSDYRNEYQGEVGLPDESPEALRESASETEEPSPSD